MSMSQSAATGALKHSCLAERSLAEGVGWSATPRRSFWAVETFSTALIDGEAWPVPLVSLEHALCYAFWVNLRNSKVNHEEDRLERWEQMPAYA